MQNLTMMNLKRTSFITVGSILLLLRIQSRFSPSYYTVPKTIWITGWKLHLSRLEQIQRWCVVFWARYTVCICKQKLQSWPASNCMRIFWLFLGQCICICIYFFQVGIAKVGAQSSRIVKVEHKGQLHSCPIKKRQMFSSVNSKQNLQQQQ